MDWLVRIACAGGSAILFGGDWRPEDDKQESAVLADDLQASYEGYMALEYSPSHGYPGYYFARRFGQNAGVLVSARPAPPSPEGQIH